MKKTGNHKALKFIAAFKLVKALLLIVVGLGSWKLVDPAAAEAAERWVTSLAWRWGPKAEFGIHQKFSALKESELTFIAIAALLYASLFVVEAVGLWRGKRWAEYLTIFATLSLIPFEIYELIRELTLPRLAALTINVLVAGYLIWRVRQPALTLAPARLA